MISGNPGHHRAGMLGTTRHKIDLAGHPDNRRLMGYGRTVRGGPSDPDDQGGVQAVQGGDQGQLPPEEAAARSRSAAGRRTTSPFATSKIRAQRRKKAARSRKGR
jgi:hypothetical protein